METDEERYERIMAQKRAREAETKALAGHRKVNRLNRRQAQARMASRRQMQAEIAADGRRLVSWKRDRPSEPGR